MRDILFRGRDPETGTWYEGQYIHLHKTTYCFAEDYEGLSGNDIHQIVFEQMTDWGLPNRHLRADVDPATVGQYTGLTDKNGAKIFEGDIVKYIYGEHFSDDEKPEDAAAKYKRQDVVRYTNGKFFPVPMREDVGDYWYSYGLFDFEIIGNIHDNPELLEGHK